MNILLVNPPDVGALSPEMDPPFNLMMIATELRRHNLEVAIAEWAATTDIPDIPKANIYGITVTTPTCNSAENLVLRIREQHPLSKIVAGGPHCSVLDVNFADVVVKGHCLGNIYEIITGSNVCTGIPNIDLGYPLSWDLIETHKYIGNRYIPECKTSISYITSTGCPMRCRFCYNPYLKLPQEHVSTNKIRSDLTYLIHHYDIDGVNILNDNNLHTYNLWELLCELGLYWRAEFSVNNIENVDVLYGLGCRYCVIGIESGSDRMLSLMNKPQNTQQVCESVRMLHDAGVAVRGLFMVGFPGETWHSVEETALFMQSLPLDSVSINLFVPYPGTEPYHNPAKFGINYLSDDFSEYRGHPVDGVLSPVFCTDKLSTDTLIKMHNYLESVKSTESM